MASGGPSWLCGRAQLGWWRYCPKLGPPGSQLVHRHCLHLAGSEEQTCPWGELWPPAVLQHLLGQGSPAPALLFKSIITGDYFQPKQRRGVRYRFQLVTSVGGSRPTAGGGKSPSPVRGSATPRVPARSAVELSPQQSRSLWFCFLPT